VNPIRPRSEVEAARLAEVEQHRTGIVQQAEHPHRSAGGDQVEIGHAAAEQRVSLTEVVVDVEAGDHPGEPLARLVQDQQLRHQVAQGVETRIGAREHCLRHRVLQHASSDRVPLGLVGVQQAVRRPPVNHLR